MTDTRGAGDVQPDDKPSDPPPAKPDADAERAEWRQWREDMEAWRRHHDEAHTPPAEPEKTEVEPRTDPPKDDKPADPPADPPKDDKPLERHSGFMW
jgi:hypothetical protein